MRSTTEVITILKSHRQTCAKIMILENALRETGAGLKNRSAAEEKLTRLVHLRNGAESWLSLLNREERFLIQTHLIDGLDWAKTIVEHEKMWGVANGRSERTLKRIQAKAIEKIVACLNQLEAVLKEEEVD